MKVTINHLYKDPGRDWNCQSESYEDVKYFETYRGDDNIMWLEIYFYDVEKQNIYIDITDYDNSKTYIECRTM